MQGLEVVAPGPHTTIQDQGRIGYQDVGVPRSGPLDRVSLALANALVGNPAAAVILTIRSCEAASIMPSFVARCDAAHIPSATHSPCE